MDLVHRRRQGNRQPVGVFGGFFRDWFDRNVRGGPTEIEEIMNPLLGWRLQHFVCIPEDREHWLRRYFVLLDKENDRREFIVFYAQTAGGWS